MSQWWDRIRTDDAWCSAQILLYYTQDFSAQYVDNFDELPFDVDSVRHHVERLVVASKPWQAWVMDVRSVYRWESPRKTGKWFLIYLVLLYNEHLIGFIVSSHHVWPTEPF